MRWIEVIEWVLILGALVSLWPVAFKATRPSWYEWYLTGVLALMAVIAIRRIRRLRRAFRDQKTK
jgi:hypothetical protein